MARQRRVRNRRRLRYENNWLPQIIRIVDFSQTGSQRLEVTFDRPFIQRGVPSLTVLITGGSAVPDSILQDPANPTVLILQYSTTVVGLLSVSFLEPYDPAIRSQLGGWVGQQTAFVGP